MTKQKTFTISEESLSHYMKMNVEKRSIFNQHFILKTLCWLQFSLTAYHSLYHSSESTNFHSKAVPFDEQSPLGAIEKRQEG